MFFVQFFYFFSMSFSVLFHLVPHFLVSHNLVVYFILVLFVEFFFFSNWIFYFLFVLSFYFLVVLLWFFNELLLCALVSLEVYGKIFLDSLHLKIEFSIDVLHLLNFVALELENILLHFVTNNIKFCYFVSGGEKNIVSNLSRTPFFLCQRFYDV